MMDILQPDRHNRPMETSGIRIFSPKPPSQMRMRLRAEFISASGLALPVFGKGIAGMSAGLRSQLPAGLNDWSFKPE